MNFPIDINPSISTLVDNAQRANPIFGKQSKSEAKIKRFKPQRTSAAQGDSTNLSGDMMGDMDPDEYKGSDHSAGFKEMLKEWRDEESKREKKEKGSEDQEQSRREPPAESYMDDEDQEKQKELQNKALKEGGASGCEESGLNQPALSTGTGSLANADVIEKSAELEAEESPYKENREEGCRKGQEKQRQYGDSDKETEHGYSGGESEHVEIAGSSPEGPSLLIHQENEFTSLLTYDDGFIIADPRKEVVPSGEDESSDGAMAEINANAEEEIIPPSLKARFDKVFSDILIYSSPSEAVEKLKAQLRRFGPGVLETCRADGVKVLIVPSGASLADYKNRFSHGFQEQWEGIRWGYFTWEKLMVIGEEAIIHGEPLVNLPILYFAFAFDHALGSEGFASEHSPAVVGNFQSCQRREGGHIFIDHFSSQSPVHYFAQAVEAFLTAPQGVLIPESGDGRTVLCTKEQLYDNDRAMFTYIEYLFKRINRS